MKTKPDIIHKTIDGDTLEIYGWYCPKDCKCKNEKYCPHGKVRKINDQD